MIHKYFIYEKFLRPVGGRAERSVIFVAPQVEQSPLFISVNNSG
jgi:hypothetical protein